MANEAAQVDASDDWQRLSSAAKTLMLGAALVFAVAYAATYVALPAAGAALAFGERLYLALYNTAMVSGGMYLAAQYSSKPINAFSSALSPYLSNIYVDPDTQKYINLKNRFEKLKPEISQHNSQIYDFYFLMYKTWLYDVNNPDWRNFVLKNISMFLEYTFKILEHPQIKATNISKEQIDVNAKKLLALLATYPQQRDAILEFAKCIGFYQLRAQEYKNIRAICLEGPPGVGKTTLMQAICDIYGINLVTLKGKATIGENHGQRQWYEDFIPSRANPIVQTLYNSRMLGFEGYTLMFFDELDKLPRDRDAAASSNLPSLQSVAQFLLELTDNEKVTIRDPYTGLDYNKDRLIVAIAVNDSILEYIPGLASRVDVIIFDKIDQETKLNIAISKLETFCAENNVFIDDEIIEVVTAMVANNHEDGVRELVEDIRGLVYALANNGFYSDTLLAKPKPEILSHYKQIVRIKAEKPAEPEEITADQKPAAPTP